MRFLKRLFRAEYGILALAGCFLCLFAFAEIAMRQESIAQPGSAVIRALLLFSICLLFYLGGRLYAERTGNKKILNALFVLFFFLYLYLLVTFTLLDESLGRGGNSVYNPEGEDPRAYYLHHFVNFIPFQSIYRVYILGFVHGYVNAYYTLFNLVGNLCALMPLSFFLPLFSRAERKWYVFLPTVILFVVVIEAMQFALMVGSCDVDDLILNAGGAMLLFALLRLPPMRRFVAWVTMKTKED